MNKSGCRTSLFPGCVSGGGFKSRKFRYLPSRSCWSVATKHNPPLSTPTTFIYLDLASIVSAPQQCHSSSLNLSRRTCSDPLPPRCCSQVLFPSTLDTLADNKLGRILTDCLLMSSMKGGPEQLRIRNELQYFHVSTRLLIQIHDHPNKRFIHSCIS